MVRPHRTTLRSAGTVVLIAGVFVLVNSQVVYAASSDSGAADFLAPLNITSSEGVPINGYELNAEGGSIVSFTTQILAFALSGLFTVIRLLVGLAGWAIEVAFRFPLLNVLIRPAQRVSDAYSTVVVDALGLKGLLLAWGFVFAGFMIVRGRVGRGLGEIFLTLLIAAFAASAFVRPDYLLAQDGPLGQAQQVAAEVAKESVDSYPWGGKLAGLGPCDAMAGMQETKCQQTKNEAPVSSTEVARPLQDAISNAVIVKPYMLLQYGRILDPAKASDAKAYAVHLKWVSGGYTGDAEKDGKKDYCARLAGPARDHCRERAGDDPCRLIIGPGKKLCQREGDAGRGLPELTPGGDLLDSVSPILSEEDREFASFLADLSRAGPVGKAAATYAEKPTWWRVGGAVLLLVAALFICGMLLSSAIVLLGIQGICAAAAAAGGVVFVAGMLPGPARQSVWKWLSLWGVSVLALVGVCAFIPAFGIAVDATITDGPDLMVERILMIDVLAIAGAAGHRRLLTNIASFGRRMAMRMRYAKVGGTHLPGDTSELGAALAMNSPTAMAGYRGLRPLIGVGAGGGRYGMLGTRHRLMGALGTLSDGAGLPVDTGSVLADATAEAGRGLAPLTAAAAVGGLGVRLGGRGAYGLLIGRRPDTEQLAKWRKPTAGADPDAGGPPAGGAGSGGKGPLRPQGPPDRYRNEDGKVVDRNTGQVLHDQHSDRTLLSTRAHNRLVRFRGYRIVHRGSRSAYGATVGLPAHVQRARSTGSRYSQDARQQVRVWANTVREDSRAWADTGRHVAHTLRDHTNDRGGPGPFTTRRLPTPPAPAPRPAGSSRSPGRTRPASPQASAAPPPASPPPAHSRPLFPGGKGASSNTRARAQDRFQELLRRTSPDAERARQQREQRQRGDDDDGGEDE
ncbi:hypothetical protein ACFU9Y_00875 [Streptomyces sp. NPDC057621]|uniref:hypothetical protein n=1 Tax=Streptomyces sp. NPDC057621 TaxID=3346186 RepID=UPI0036A7A7B8